MKRIVKVKHVAEAKTGVSKSTGSQWIMTDVVIEWKQEDNMCDAYECSLCVTTTQELDREKLGKAMAAGRDMECRFYPSVHEYNGRYFNSVRAYFPGEYCKMK